MIGAGVEKKNGCPLQSGEERESGMASELEQYYEKLTEDVLNILLENKNANLYFIFLPVIIIRQLSEK